MDTSALKRFAIQARTKIREGVKEKLTELGFDAEGKPKERPRLVEGAALFAGELREASFFHQWRALESDIQERGLKAVHEEAAYTWFNRLMAIFILQKNALTGDTLSFDNPDIRIPHIVSEARQGRFPRMDEAEELRLTAIIGDATKTYEQFSLLVVAFCHATPVIQSCFGSAVDYTELLLPRDILERDGFLDMLNHSPFITDEDYEATELLGWLYQFYNSERKDEVYRKLKKGLKVEAEDIAPATQIFTPNWIVKYMVQNTLGRIYLDNNPDSPLQDTMKYLVAPAEPAQEDNVFRYGELENLTLLDPACGSGHVLLEAFDLLYLMYLRAGYQRREAVECILRHNLTGIDIDTRAKQLASFALLLKACQKDSSFKDARVMPNILGMPHGVNLYTWRDTVGHLECNLPTGRRATPEENEQIAQAFLVMENACLLGSIMRLSLSEGAREYMRTYLRLFSDKMLQGNFRQVRDSFRLMLALTDKYAAVVTNPPYMGSGNMNATLSKYVQDNYAEGKADLFAVFMLDAAARLAPKGKYGMITMHSWMFLSSFEKLRKSLLGAYHIESMLHLGARTFDELSGEIVQNTAFVIGNEMPACGSYFRLLDGKDCADKERLFLKKAGLYPNVPQQNFKKIPGCPIGYWVSDNFIKAFKLPSITEYAKLKAGLATGDNKRFFRLWWEVNPKNIGFGVTSSEETATRKEKWYPCLSGGYKRKWSDYIEYVVDWLNDGYNLKHFYGPNGRLASRPQNTSYYFKEGITWNKISSGAFTVRYKRSGSIFDDTSRCAFTEDIDLLYYLIGLLCSKVTSCYLGVFNPTLSYTNGDIERIPIKVGNQDEINELVVRNLDISKQDWDAHETSWDFKENGIVRLYREQTTAAVEEKNPCGFDPSTAAVEEKSRRGFEQKTVRSLVESYKSFWESQFMRLHANEEELNRQFIDIYGLEGELSPDVPLRVVTILQQGEISIEGDEEKICWHEDVLMRQLISYAVGCMMGRYRLDRPGLAIAHPDTTEEETRAYTYQSEEFEIDDDAIIPLMPTDSPFLDNAAARFSNFLRIAFGKELHTENLNYVERQLGKSVEEYMMRDFWADHKRIYQNRPVYWLFQSRKGAFRCIAYMHRMNKYTAQQIRDKYLLKHIDYLKQQIAGMERRKAELGAADLRHLEKLRKNLDDCQEYDTRLHDVAERQIELDLDDGVARNYALFGDVLAKLK